MVIIDHPWVGEFATNGWLVPLDHLLDDRVRADVDPASLASYTYDGRQWALPIDAACQMMVYRTEVVRGPLPDDWDDLLDFAKEFHDPPRRWAFAQAWQGPTGGGVAAFLLLLSIAHALGEKPYESPGYSMPHDVAARGLQILQRVWDLCIPRSEMRGLRVDEFLHSDDRVAIGPGAFPFVTNYRQDADRALALTDMPTVRETGIRTSALGGTGLAIATTSPNRILSCDYARFVIDPATQSGVYLDAGGQPGSRSAMDSVVANDRLGGFGRRLSAALDGCYTRPRYPGWRHIEETANAAVLEHLIKGGDVRTTSKRIDAIADTATFSA
jgi:Maltose-binding periplasmic proteins/domains